MKNQRLTLNRISGKTPQIYLKLPEIYITCQGGHEFDVNPEF